MKTQYSFLLVITVLLLLLTPNTTDAAVNLPWSTTYNCPEWKQTDGNPNCDNLAYYGAWTTTDGKEEQITSTANYSGSGSGGGCGFVKDINGKGQKAKGEGVNHDGSYQGLSLILLLLLLIFIWLRRGYKYLVQLD